MAEAAALECKSQWCSKILSGEKTVESRRYPLPPELIGKPIWLLESSGEEGKSSVPDIVPASFPGLALVGKIVVGSVKEYLSKNDWDEDKERHCVPADTPYSWKEGGCDKIYGWEISHKEVLQAPLSCPSMRRQYRSIFKFQA